MNLKYILIILSFALLLPVEGFSQNPLLKKLERKAKAKIQQRAERKADRAMDKGLDKVEEGLDKSVKKNKSKKEKGAKSTSASSSASAMEGAQAPQEQKPEQKDSPKEEKESRPALFGKKEAKEPEPFEPGSFSNESISDRGTIGKGPYGIPSGSFVQKTTVFNDMMKSYQWDTVFFADYGHLQARHQYVEQHIKMMGIKRKEINHTHAVHREGSIYSHDLQKDKGFVMDNPANQIYQGMDEAQVKEFAAEMEANMNTKKELLGTAYMAGKLCEVLEYTTYDEAAKVMMRTRMWWWRGMMLKSHSRGMGSEIIQEVLEITAGGQKDSKRFQPNPRVKYQSFSLDRY